MYLSDQLRFFYTIMIAFIKFYSVHINKLQYDILNDNMHWIHVIHHTDLPGFPMIIKEYYKGYKTSLNCDFLNFMVTIFSNTWIFIQCPMVMRTFYFICEPRFFY